MKKQKGENKIVLCMLLLACLLSVVPVVPSRAGWLDFGWETLEYTDEEEKDDDELCNLSNDITEAQNKGKWWKVPLETALNAALTVGETVFTTVAPSAQKLMIVGGMLWLAIFTLKIVGSMVESDPMENFTKIGGMMLKIGIAAIFLNGPYFFDKVVATVVQTGAGFVDTSAIASAAGGGITPGEINVSGGLMAVKETLMKMADDTHQLIGDVIGRGRFLGCIGDIHKLSLSVAGDITFPDPKVWMSSCVIVLGAYAFLFLFPFYLIEACVRLGIVVALGPLFVVAWVFDVTRDFTKKGLNALLHVAFTFMMIKIIIVVATKLLMGGSGLDKLQTGSDDEKKQIVCTFRWGYLGDKDVCEGIEKGETNGMFVYLACIVYGWLLLQKGNELANYYSSTSFSADSSFAATRSAAQMVQKSVQKGGKAAVKAAGAVKDRIQTHKDRAAARTYERDQQARAVAASGGRPYNPSAKQQKKVEAAKKRLQSDRVGALNRDGTENGQKMAKLLENGKARTAMRGLEKVHNATVGRLADKVGVSKFGQKLSSEASSLTRNGNFFERQVGKVGNRIGKGMQDLGRHDKFKNMGNSYSERSAEELQRLKSVAPASSVSSASSTSSGNRTSTGGAAPSGSGRSSLSDVNSRGTSTARSSQHVNTPQEAAKYTSDLSNQYNQELAKRTYPDTEQGRNQRTYDQLRGQQLNDLADFNKKAAADPEYRNSAEGKAASQNLSDTANALQDIRSEYNVNDNVLETAHQQMNRQENAQTMAAVSDQYQQDLANQKYDNTPQGQNQKAYDHMRGDHFKDVADQAKKRAADSNYDKTPEGIAQNKRISESTAALMAMEAEHNVNRNLLSSSWDKVLARQGGK